MSEKKPYVIYEINASLHDKGVGYSIKKAVNAFLATHNLEARVTDFEAHSDRMSARLEVFDNGNLDMNARALLDHINNSGQLPTKNTHKPEITIIPIERDETPKIVQSADNILWQKTLEKIQHEFDEYKKQHETERTQKEQTIQYLSDSLNERQKVISRQGKEIKILEERIASAKPSVFNAPSDAIINTYLPKSEEAVFEVAADFVSINENKEREAIQKSDCTIFDYLRIIHGMNFTTEQDYSLWKEKMSTPSYVQSTITEYESKKNEIIAEKELLNIAEQKGVSGELLEFLKNKVAKSEETLKKIDENIKTTKETYQKEKEKYEKINEIENRFKQFKQIQEKAHERKLQHATLPVLVEIFGADAGQITIPMISSNDSFSDHLRSLATRHFTSGAAVTFEEKENHNTYKSKFGPNGFQPKEDYLLSALGLKIEYIVLTRQTQ
jgi:uncharacterized coiled-coil protein SlyX